VTTAMGKTIGETLRDGRNKQRLTISECAKRTHIASRYLEALEEEKWDVLPSESHRMGFLSLYAKFLGVYSDDLVQSYKQSKQAPVSGDQSAAPEPSRVAPPRPPEKTVKRMTNVTWPTLSLIAIIGLIGAWGLYHGVRHYQGSAHDVDLSWLKSKPRRLEPRTPVENREPRLTAPTRSVPVQHLRVRADADSWLRVADNRQLIFEGILPAGAVKEWSGPGPFRIKLGNVNAMSVYWNDQPVDTKATARGHVADLQLPPPQPEKS
jgi:cytoskeleton protein RodZ